MTVYVPTMFFLEQLEGSRIALGNSGPPGLAGLFRNTAVRPDFHGIGTIVGCEGVSDLDLPVAVAEEMIRGQSHG